MGTVLELGLKFILRLSALRCAGFSLETTFAMYLEAGAQCKAREVQLIRIIIASLLTLL